MKFQEILTVSKLSDFDSKPDVRKVLGDIMRAEHQRKRHVIFVSIQILPAYQAGQSEAFTLTCVCGSFGRTSCMSER